MATLLDSDASLTDESLEEMEMYLSDEDSPGTEKILLPRNVSTEYFYMHNLLLYKIYDSQITCSDQYCHTL